MKKANAENLPPEEFIPYTGTDDFVKLVSKGGYVDKTPFIAEFHKSRDDATLLVDPRRWGKTLIMTALEYFYSNHPDNTQNSNIFDSLSIAKVDDGAFLKRHQGQYPVISITIKNTAADSMDEFIQKLWGKIKDLFGKHSYLLRSDKLEAHEKKAVDEYLSGQGTRADLGRSLLVLCRLLEKHWNKKVYLFIDEYDSPLNHAFYYYLTRKSAEDRQVAVQLIEDITLFLKDFFGAAMKSNNSLEKGLMTGILRISKNSMLSEMNNLKVYCVLEEKYSGYFGFSEEEVLIAFQRLGFSGEQVEQARLWYNGYSIEHLIRYNPWSVMSCLKSLYEKSSTPYQCYWVQTGSIDNTIKQFMFDGDEGTKQKIRGLIAGESILGATIGESVIFEDLLKDNPASKEQCLLTLLLYCGYLTATNVSKDGVNYICDLSIPNFEVRKNYEGIFAEWLKNKLGNLYQDISRSLLDENIDEFTHLLRQALTRVFSLRDLSKERDYQMVLGTILAGIQRTHQVKSNREEGDGYPDFVVTPNPGHGSIGFIIELKHLKRNDRPNDFDERKSALEEMSRDEALKQINDRQYEEALAGIDHVRRVLRLGIAFTGKKLVCAYTVSDVGHDLEEVENEVNFSYGLSNSPDPKRRKKAKDDQDEQLEESSYEPMVEDAGNEPDDEDNEHEIKKRDQNPQESPRSSASDEGKLSFFGAGKRQKKHNSDDEILKSQSPSHGSGGSD
jgi:hypothetical protein